MAKRWVAKSECASKAIGTFNQSVTVNKGRGAMLLAVRIIAIMLLFAAVATSITSPWQAAEVYANNITPTSSFQSGDGTRDNPYIIQTAAQLSYLASVINNNTAGFNTSSVFYAMGADIVFNSNHANWATYGTTPPANNWNTPIGSNANTNARFKANFDGRGFTIRGLYINSTESNRGLFGYVASGARIAGITIENSYIKASTAVGAVIGLAENSVNISNCRNVSTHVEATGNGSAGGIVGTFGNGRIDDCSNTGGKVLANFDALASSSRYAGGIAGFINASGAAINSCVNTGIAQGFRMGGMLGYSSGSVSISNCYNSGAMTGTLHAVDSESISSYCQTYQGGIAGQTGSSSIFINCRNTAAIAGNGTMSAQSISTAGIVGNSGSSTSIYNCYNSGNMSYSNLGNIRNGGIIGESSSGTVIMGAISIGTVAGSSQSGSIAGFLSSNVGQLSYCFYQNSTTATNKLIGYSSSILAGAGNAEINSTGGLVSPTSITYSGTSYTNAFNALNAWAASSPAIQTTIKPNPINVSAKEFQTTITFDSQGGGAKSSVTKNMNAQYTAADLASVTRANYTFQGWWTRLPSGDWGVKLSTQNYAAETRTAYARWIPVNAVEPVTVDLTYREVGGGAITIGNAPTSPTKHTSNVTTVLPTMSASGYRFDGWCLQSNGSDAPLMALAADLYTADVILYAKWTRIKYDIVFVANGGTGTMSEQSFFQNESKALSANSFTPASGNRFRGWATTPTGNVARANQEVVMNLSSVHNAKVYLYAAWTANTTLYTMTAVTAGDLEGGNIVSGATASLVQTAAAPVNISTNPGFQVTATTTSGTISASITNVSYRFVMASADAMVTFTFSGVNHYFGFNANGGTGSMSSQSRKYNESIALPSNTTITRVGYKFKGWNTVADGSGISYADGETITKAHIAPTNNQTLTLFAQWDPNTYYVTYNSNPPRQDMAVQGSMNTTTLVYNDGNGALAKNTFQIQGRVFKGWALSEVTPVVYTDGQSVKNLTSGNEQVVELFAVWGLEVFNNTGFEPGNNKFVFTDANGDEIDWTDYVLGDKLFLEKVAPDESLENLLQQFDNRLRVRGIDDAVIHEIDIPEITAATGMKLELLGYGDEVLSSALIVVLGDLTGTGTVDMDDIMMVNNHRLYRTMGTATAENFFQGSDARLAGMQFMSADINSNGIINMGVIISVNNYRLYKEGSDPFADIRIKK